MASYTELYIDQGTDFENIINLDADDGSPINVTGYHFSSQIRKSFYSSANAVANITMTIVNNNDGIISMTMNAATTANIVAGRYVYDVKMKDSSNATSRLVEGIITINPQVTV